LYCRDPFAESAATVCAAATVCEPGDGTQSRVSTSACRVPGMNRQFTAANVSKNQESSAGFTGGREETSERI